VKELADSIRELGLLNPVTVDRENNLIAGLHRLEAVRVLGWNEVECTVSSLEGLQAELAEIDENFVRSGLSAIEYGEMLLRRKEIYEALHPETKAGIAQAAAMNRAIGNNVADKMSAASKSFVEDTAAKLNVAPRTVRREIQTAKNLTQEAKEIMKGADANISKKAAMKLSRLEPGQQKEAAALLTAKKIRTVDEYAARAEGHEQAGMGQGTMEKDNREPGMKPDPPALDMLTESDCHEVLTRGCGLPAVLQEEHTRQEGHAVSFKALVAELKDPDKDCSGTPESFMEEYEAFVRKFHREIGWYNDPYYDTVYPCLDSGQLASLREMTQAICSAAEGILHKAERMVKK